MLPTALAQTFATNRFDAMHRSAVKQVFRRNDRDQPKFDFDRMPLPGADARTVVANREALLVIGRDDLIDQRARERMVGLREPDQCVDLGPALAIER